MAKVQSAQALTPAKALQLITANDPSFTECDLSGNALFSMKSGTWTKDITAALKTNTNVTRLILSNLGITDSAVKFVADLLRENQTITYVNLSKNKIGSPGLIDLAEAIMYNKTLLDIDLLGQSQPFGDQALAKVIHLFSYNITLKNITWRLQSRQSFAINKLIVRNNEIERRLQSGKDIMDILPEERKAEFGGVPAPVSKAPVNSDKPAESQTGEEVNPEEGYTSPRHDSHSVIIDDPNSPPSTEEKSEPQSPSTQEKPKSESKTPISEEKPKIGLGLDLSKTKTQDTKPQPLSARKNEEPVVPEKAPTPAPQTSRVPMNRANTHSGNRMLQRYLQAAQANDNSEQSKKIKIEGLGASKLASAWENKIDEKTQEAVTPRIKPGAPTTSDAKSPQTAKVASIWKDKFEADNSHEKATLHKTHTSSGLTRNISTSNKVASKWVPQEAEVKKTVEPPKPTGSVASKWVPQENEVKKTVVDVPSVGTTGGSVTSKWVPQENEVKKTVVDVPTVGATGGSVTAKWVPTEGEVKKTVVDVPTVGATGGSVTAKWVPTEGEVKKTVVDIPVTTGTGGASVTSKWVPTENEVKKTQVELPVDAGVSNSKAVWKDIETASQKEDDPKKNVQTPRGRISRQVAIKENSPIKVEKNDDEITTTNPPAEETAEPTEHTSEPSSPHTQSSHSDFVEIPDWESQQDQNPSEPLPDQDSNITVEVEN